MSDDTPKTGDTIVIKSIRFGELTVPADSVITFPSGLVGFPRAHRFVMLDYKPPFSWLHSVEDPGLAFVVIDGFEVARTYDLKPPIGDKDCDLQNGEDYAVLVIVTVRPDAKDTTANLKAPLFVNIRNRRGVQVIYDDPNLSTRFALWQQSEAEKKDESKTEDEKPK